jgi:hypothetical protein
MSRNNKPSLVAARGECARQRILKQLASLPTEKLRTVPAKTIAVLSWIDIVELIALRHEMRRLKKGSLQYYLSCLGYQLDLALNYTRKLAKYVRTGIESATKRGYRPASARIIRRPTSSTAILPRLPRMTTPIFRSGSNPI